MDQQFQKCFESISDKNIFPKVVQFYSNYNIQDTLYQWNNYTKQIQNNDYQILFTRMTNENVKNKFCYIMILNGSFKSFKHIWNDDTYRYFPKVFYKEVKPIINEEGEYSITKPIFAQNVVQIILSHSKKQNGLCGVDMTGNVGGDTIMFGLCQQISRVDSFEINEQNYQILKHNVNEYLLTDKITIHNKNSLEWFKKNDNSDNKNDYDFVYCDPPWGGKEYKQEENIDLFLTDTNKHGKSSLITVYKYVREYTNLFCVKVPLNFAFDRFQKQIKKNYENQDQVYLYEIRNKFCLCIIMNEG